MKTVELDWTKLLGFDQAKPGCDFLRQAVKVGAKGCDVYREFYASPSRD